jgi:hypothetical protein
MSQQKNLSDGLYAIAEQVTQGKYGRRNEVDVEALDDDLQELLLENSGGDEGA